MSFRTQKCCKIELAYLVFIHALLRVVVVHALLRRVRVVHALLRVIREHAPLLLAVICPVCRTKTKSKFNSKFKIKAKQKEGRATLGAA
jgi:hypothetical protein